MKTFLLRKRCEVFIAHTLADSFNLIGLIEPHIVIIEALLFAQRKEMVKQILDAFPSVKLIVCGRDSVYKNTDETSQFI